MSGNSHQSQSHHYSSRFWGRLVFGNITLKLSLLKKKNPTAETFTFTGASSCVSMDSSILTTPSPFSTWPKTTCLPSKCDVGTVVMKNWEPLVLGPALAMLRRPTLSCCVKKVTHKTQQHIKKKKTVQTVKKQARDSTTLFIKIAMNMTMIIMFNAVLSIVRLIFVAFVTS